MIGQFYCNPIKERNEMKKLIVSVAILGLCMQTQGAFAKSLEDVLKEKGVITQQDYDEVTKTPPEQVTSMPATPPDEGGYTVKMKGITVNLGGFIEAAGIYRNRNLISDIASPYKTLPLPISAPFYEDETRFSARQSRLSLLATGDYSPTTHLSGYYEMDFLGGAPTANSNESNSYNPRIRHLYTTADWDNLGLHILGGQTWSLITLNNKGITPHNEVTPQTIDAQYVPGFTWTRQPQFRITKDWNKMLWMAVSVENAQSTSGGTGQGTNLAISQAPPSGSNFGQATLSANDYPDFVAKVAFEPGWGHFEVYDLLRTYESVIAPANSVHKSHITTTGIGAGIILPLVPNHLTLSASGMYGEGIGRYGSAQLPDVSVDANGNICPLKESMFLVGLTADPVSSLTLYTYYGQEQIQDKVSTYGNALDNTQGSSTFGTSTFNGNVKRVSQITAGEWWKFLQGKYGKMQLGLQYSYTVDKYFVGTGGAPNASDNMVFTSLRYYWQ
jgi:hypothetical protein